ncbi:MAG: iron-containing alcohol dehydrogenase [Candidatus Competibacteraceae bacterium]|nr:iron-containing alcohol dehydrogenase [Candidatus Competibacteraceae bacterium]HRY14589.1 iron-containing alcohol dehydrogenase [Candidatus Competibacteraceae bacterium]
MQFVAPEFIFGVGARRRAGFYARNLQARRVLVVTDPGIIRAGWLNELLSDLEESGLQFVVFRQVTPNPRDHEVMVGVEMYHSEGCDVIIALGGGSSSPINEVVFLRLTNHLRKLPATVAMR